MSRKILNLSVCFMCFTLGLLVNTSILLINDLLIYKQEMLDKNNMPFISGKSAISSFPSDCRSSKNSKIVLPRSDFELKFGVNQAWRAKK